MTVFVAFQQSKALTKRPEIGHISTENPDKD